MEETGTALKGGIAMRWWLNAASNHYNATLGGRLAVRQASGRGKG